jgi:hypothetical protein
MQRFLINIGIASLTMTLAVTSSFAQRGGGSHGGSQHGSRMMPAPSAPSRPSSSPVRIQPSHDKVPPPRRDFTQPRKPTPPESPRHVTPKPKPGGGKKPGPAKTVPVKKVARKTKIDSEADAKNKKAKSPPKPRKPGAPKPKTVPALKINNSTRGPAKAAGLSAGDTILKIEGIAIKTIDDLRRIVGGARGPVNVQYLCAATGQVCSMSIMPENGRLGVDVEETTAEIADEASDDDSCDATVESDEGLEILELLDGPAQDEGLRVGDIIVSIDGQATPTIDDLKSIVRAANGDVEVVYINSASGEWESITLTPNNGKLGVMAKSVELPVGSMKGD